MSTSSTDPNASSTRNAESSIQLEERSEDSDSGGSIKDFIVSSSESDEEGVYTESVLTDDEEVTTASTALAAELIDSVPFDISGAGSVTNSSGLRRSTRRRKPVERYVDENFLKMMLDDVSSDGLEEEEDEDDAQNIQVNPASEDEDYEYDEEEAEAEMSVDDESTEDDEDDDAAYEADTDDDAEDTGDDAEDIAQQPSRAPLADWVDDE